MHRRARQSLSWPMWGAAALFMCALLTQRVHAQPAPVRLITTGQELADAVAEFGRTGQDMTLELAAPRIDLRAAVFTPWNNATDFQSGVLTIMGNYSRGYTPVLDAGQRSNLTPPFAAGSAARIKLQNLITINMCQQPIFLNRKGLVSLSVYDMGLFRRSRQQQSQVLMNMRMYGRKWDVAKRVFLYLMQVTELPLVRAMAAPLLEDMPDFLVTMDSITAWRVTTAAHVLPAVRSFNVSAVSLEDPRDPLLPALQPHLLPDTFCNGTTAPPAWVHQEVDRQVGPLWLTGDSPGLWHGLRAAANISVEQWQLRWPVASVMVTSSLQLDGWQGPVPVPGPVFLTGLPRRDLAVPRDTRLDLRALPGPLLTLMAPGGQLFIQDLTLSGLSAQPVPVLRGNTAGSGGPRPLSVFPLQLAEVPEGGEDRWAVDPPVWLHNSTLVLPVLDYLALRVLAAQYPGAARLGLTAGCEGEDVQHLAHVLSPGFSQVQPVARLGSGVVLRLLGWGLNGTDLVVTPESPAPPECVAPPSSRTTAHVGLIVGCSVAGAVVVLAVGLGLVWVLRRRRAAPPSRPAKPAPDSDAGAGVSSAEESGGVQPGLVSCTVVRGDSVRADSPPPSGWSEGRPVTLAQLVALSPHNVEEGGPLPDPQLNSEGTGTDGPGSHEPPVCLPLSSGTDGEAPMLSKAGDDVGAGWAQLHRHDSRSGGAVSADPPSHVMLSFLRAPVKALSHTLFPSSPAPPPVPAVQSRDGGRVVIRGVLGRGAWGTVYRGEWRGLDVALKTLVFPADQLHGWGGPSGDAQGPALPGGAITEAAIAASVGHPNVVSTFLFDIKPCNTLDTHTTPGGLQVDASRVGGDGSAQPREYKLYLVQELCACTLADALQAHAHINAATGAVEPASVFGLLLDIARGLAYLHGRGIVHGDLKPANVLLKSDRGRVSGVIAKLTDFGLSVAMGPGTHVSNFKSGTPFYVSPEVIRHSKVSPAADIYGLGVIMWQLYTGLSPWQDDGDLRSWNPVFPKFFAPRIPPMPYISLAYRALQHQPNLRPTAEEVVAQLTALATTLAPSEARMG